MAQEIAADRPFLALFEAAQDAVLIADDERRYTKVNAAAGMLFGMTPEELKGRRVEEFVEEIPGSTVSESWGQFQATGVQRGECRLRRPDGTLREVEYSATSNFAPGLHLSILRDITERKRQEKALEQSVASLRQFVYSASHDLQEPLRAIVSFSQLLQTRCSGLLDAESVQCLDFIGGSASHMKELVDSLLTYASVVNIGALPFAVGPLEADLNRAILNLQALIAETGARVSHGPLPDVNGDHVQLAQVFQNLIGNAMKYRKPGVVPEIHVSAQARETEWVISVRDNGIGIAREHAEIIFGVFKRLHGREIAGTGIGLAICKEVVERHGGQIRVESDTGQGATFVFTLAR